VQLVTRHEKRVLVLDSEDHGGEWRRRVEGLAGPGVLDDILWIAPLRDGHGPIWTSAEAIRDYALANDVDYIVVDSAAYACSGGDPSKAEIAIQYGAALQVIGIPSLTLAHVTKLHDARYPFGSAFWLSSTRAGWSLMPKGEDVLLVCRKASNYQKPGASTVTMTWFENILREVNERAAHLTLADRIAEILADGPMTPTAITAALNEGVQADEHVSANTVRRTLNRGVGSRFTVDGDARWSLAGGL
jgi:hypothetical protein